VTCRIKRRWCQHAVPLMRKVVQPKQKREIHDRAVAAEALTNRIYDLLIARDASSPKLDTENRSFSGFHSKQQ
jgi:hypothetical protein